MAILKPGQIDITPGGKKYVTLWRPDGQPMSVNVTNPRVGGIRINDLVKMRGYTETNPNEKKPKAKAAKHEL